MIVKNGGPVDESQGVSQIHSTEMLALSALDSSVNEQLRRSEERFHRLFMDAAVGIVVTDAERRILQANQAYCCLLGYSPRELLDVDFLALTHEDDRAHNEAMHMRLLAGEIESFVIEKRLVTKSGELVWARVSVSLVRDDNANPLHGLAIVEDVSKQRVAETKLKENESLLKMASQVGKLGGWRVDLPDFVLTWSEEVCAIHEVPPDFSPSVEDAIGFYAPEYLETINRVFAACVEEGTPFVEELQIITAKGRRVWVRAIGEAVRDIEGVITHVQGALQDITERKAAEHQVHQGLARFRQLADAMPLIVWTADAEGQIGFANEALTEYTGIQGDELRDGAWARVLHPDDCERALAVWAESLQEGKVYEAEFRIQRRLDNAYRWHAVRSVPIRDGNGKVIKWYGSGIDIHDSKMIEEEASRLAKRLTTTLESLTDAFFTLDHDWRITYLNQEAERLMNRRRADVLGKVVWEEFPGSEQSAYYQAYHRARDENVVVKLEIKQTEHERCLDVRVYPSEEGLAVYLQDVTEGKRAEEALRASEARLKNAERVAHLGNWEMTIATGASVWSEEFYRICGYEPYSIESTAEVGFSLIHPDDREMASQTLNQAIASRGTYAIEKRIVRPDGTVIWVDSRGEVVCDDAGTPVKLVGSFQDITQRKKAEQTLRQSEERFRLLSRATHDAIWEWNLVTNTLWWNEGIEALFGLHRDEIKSDLRSWAEHLHAEDRERIVQVIQKALQEGGTHWQEEYRIVRQDGTTAYVQDRGYVIRNEAGEAVRVVGGMSDQTAQKLSQKRLQEQAALLDKAPNAILVQDLQNRITYWNQGAARLYGWEAQEVIGCSVIQLLYEDPLRFYQIMDELLIQGEWSGELEHTNRDGIQILIEGHWSLLRDDANEPHSILAIHTDITERKKLEVQFLRAQRLESIGTLAGGIAHDLNNILAPILLSIPMLKRGTQSDRDLRRLEMLEESAKRGAEMVRQVLTFARGMEGRRERIEVDQIARDVMKLMQDTLGKNISLFLDIPEEIWAIEGDSTQIHQVLVNLCVNARDAMPAGGEIVLSVDNLYLDSQYASMDPEAQPGPYVRITVADTGVGIPKEIRERIFDPFFTTKATGSGTGLGLSTVRGIVKGHRGFVNVYSEEGKGTAFRIYLPAIADDSIRRVATVTENLPVGNGELILVVDDEYAVRSITQQTLEAFGYRVILAEDGAEALSLFVQHQAEIAVVLTDMMMPVMDGFATIQALHRIDPTTKIIAASGLAANGMVAKAAEAGVTNFLAKPFSAETLLTSLERVLK